MDREEETRELELLEEERRQSRLAALAEEAAARVREKAAKKARELALKAFKKVFLKAVVTTTKWVVVTIGGAVFAFIGFWGCLVIIIIVVLVGIAGLIPEAKEPIFAALAQGLWIPWKIYQIITGK